MQCHVVFFQSASFGKGFLGPDVSPEIVNEFVEMCHHLRVLNSVRMEDIGLPITLRQYPLMQYIIIFWVLAHIHVSWEEYHCEIVVWE